MSETITLMKSHTSVRRFKEEAIPQEDLNTIYLQGKWLLLGKISILFCDCSQKSRKERCSFELVPQEAIRQSAAFLLFVGDLNRAEKRSSSPYRYFPTSRCGRAPHYFSRCSTSWAKYASCGRKPWIWWSNHRFGALQIC